MHARPLASCCWLQVVNIAALCIAFYQQSGEHLVTSPSHSLSGMQSQAQLTALSKYLALGTSHLDFMKAMRNKHL
jgi:hypothetical protein